jgi:hypothetical protein
VPDRGSERCLWGTLRTGDDGKDPIVVSQKVIRRLMKQGNMAIVYYKKDVIATPTAAVREIVPRIS